jgi:hypothetical protein
MSSRVGPTMIVASQHGKRVAMGVDHVARVLGPESNMEYCRAPSSEQFDSQRTGNVVRRTLGRAKRLIDEMKAWRVLPHSAHLGASILRDKKSGVHFPEVTWKSERGDAVRHWLRLRRPLKEITTPPAGIRFVTGTCLFGRSAVMHLEDGSQRPLVSTKQQLPAPIAHLTVLEDFSLYELDTACRLSSVIRDMAGDSSKPHIYLHIPRPEYILVMMGHQRGKSGGRIMSDWLAAVGRRSQRVSELFEACLTMQSGANIDIGSPLDNILLPYLHEAIEHDKSPSPHELADLIHHSNTEVAELFKQWLSVCKGNSDDLDYYDLAQFGYVAGVAVNLAEGMLTIEVDNPSEEPIFKAASRVVRRCSERASGWRGNAMAVYPYEQMASWREGPADWGRVTRTAVDGDAVKAIMSQYGIDMRQRDYVVQL